MHNRNDNAHTQIKFDFIIPRGGIPLVIQTENVKLKNKIHK